MAVRKALQKATIHFLQACGSMSEACRLQTLIDEPLSFSQLSWQFMARARELATTLAALVM